MLILCGQHKELIQYMLCVCWIRPDILDVEIDVCYLLEYPHSGHHATVFLGAAEIMG